MIMISEEKLYRALGMAVALTKFAGDGIITDDAKVWADQIRNFAELSDDQIREIQESAAGNLNPIGKFTSRAE